MTSFYDGEAAAGIDERYRLVIDGERFELASTQGGRQVTADEPDLVLTGCAKAVMAARSGETTLGQAIAAGVIVASGSKRALRNFQRVFRLR